MDKGEHAAALRAAMAEKGVSNRELSDATGVAARTVGNWISRKAPTMPSETDLAKLRRLFPGYDTGGDPVEAALAKSELVEWRRKAVLSEYERHVFEQRREAGAVVGETPRP